MFRQSLDQRLSFTAQLEPIKEFTIDLNLDKTFTKDYSELFKVVSDTGRSSSTLVRWLRVGLMCRTLHSKPCFKKTIQTRYHQPLNSLKITASFYRNGLQKAIHTKRAWEHRPMASTKDMDGMRRM